LVETGSIPLGLAAEWISFSNFFNYALDDPSSQPAASGLIQSGVAPWHTASALLDAAPAHNSICITTTSAAIAVGSLQVVVSKARDTPSSACALPLRASDARYSRPGETPYGAPERHYIATEWWGIDLSER
jgi:hypothetical protein